MLPSFKDFLAEEKDSGIYASFKLDPATAERLHQFYTAHLGDTVQPPHKFHVTTVYSPKAFNYEKYDGPPLTANAVALDAFGMQTGGHVLVLKLSHPVLHERWEQSLKNGAQWSYPDFKPHISLTKYDCPLTDPTCCNSLPLPDFPVVLSHEEIEPLDNS